MNRRELLKASAALSLLKAAQPVRAGARLVAAVRRIGKVE